MFEVRIGATTTYAFLALSTWAQPALLDGIARGDAAFSRRAEGGRNGSAAPEPIGDAIRAYQEALAQLEQVSAIQPRRATEVEDLAVRREARERLQEESAAAGGLQ